MNTEIKIKKQLLIKILGKFLFQKKLFNKSKTLKKIYKDKD